MRGNRNAIAALRLVLTEATLDGDETPLEKLITLPYEQFQNKKALQNLDALAVVSLAEIATQYWKDHGGWYHTLNDVAAWMPHCPALCPWPHCRYTPDDESVTDATVKLGFVSE